MHLDSLVLLAAIATVAFLYSIVGHAGASGYIAVLSLAGFAAVEIRPAALVLNILVASLATWQFYRAGHFSARLFWPFALTSIPLAFVGGWIHLPGRALQILLGLVLLAAAIRFFLPALEEAEPQAPPLPVAALTGAAIGLVAGLTGTGGGIFLTPLLLWRRWSKTRTAAAVSAPFILANSLAGLAGLANQPGAPVGFSSIGLTPLAVALVGGAFGAYLGARRLRYRAIQRFLAVVLSVAGLKLLFAL
jgi:uncharacterized membrane protein YfcA